MANEETSFETGFIVGARLAVATINTAEQLNYASKGKISKVLNS